MNNQDYKPDSGDFDVMKCSWNSLMRYYASQTAISLIESGSKGVLSVMHEISIVIKERHTPYVRNKIIEEITPQLDELKRIASTCDKKTEKAINSAIEDIKKAKGPTT